MRTVSSTPLSRRKQNNILYVPVRVLRVVAKNLHIFIWFVLLPRVAALAALATGNCIFSFNKILRQYPYIYNHLHSSLVSLYLCVGVWVLICVCVLSVAAVLLK